ncbi:MAG TPA: hypothetical protein VMH92_11145 [Acidocella sp.]|nr:hypothetical protein [Acidocella sp.]
MPKPNKPAAKTNALPLKPGLIVIAIICLRAAAAQPAQFNLGAVVVWLVDALAAGLFAYAALALLIPGGAIAYAYGRRSLARLGKPAGGG